MFTYTYTHVHRYSRNVPSHSSYLTEKVHYFSVIFCDFLEQSIYFLLYFLRFHNTVFNQLFTYSPLWLPSPSYVRSRTRKPTSLFHYGKYLFLVSLLVQIFPCGTQDRLWQRKHPDTRLDTSDVRFYYLCIDLECLSRSTSKTGLSRVVCLL